MLKFAAIILIVIGLAVFREWMYLSIAMWAAAGLLLVTEGVVDIVYVGGILLIAAILWFITQIILI